MVDTRTNKATSDEGNASQARPTGKATAAGSHLAAAASIDELLAKEAIANLRRTRATAHTDAIKSKARVPVPPARLVVRPPQSQAWMTPFISLAVIVGISTFLSAGGLAYLLLRPTVAAKTSDAELRNIRETVAQLRRNIAELSNDAAANRIALTAANKATSDRFARFAQNLDRVERDRAMPSTRTERAAEENAQVARQTPADPSPEITGSIQRPPRSTRTQREVITGWHVRRAYDSVAILEGQSGVIEVALGQDVPELGRIQEIKYENGRWRVLTSKGVINPVH